MLKRRSIYTSHAVDMHTAIMECVQEGKEVDAYIDRAKTIAAMDFDDTEREKKAGELLDELDLLPIRNGFPYSEPSDLAGIMQLRPVMKDGPKHVGNKCDRQIRSGVEGFGMVKISELAERTVEILYKNIRI